jgi:hypothetical protein
VRRAASPDGSSGTGTRPSAQLLLLAFLGAERGEFRVHAITDLGWPVFLLDLALGVLGHDEPGPPPGPRGDLRHRGDP